MVLPLHFTVISLKLDKFADNLRANSNLLSNEYFLPIPGLIQDLNAEATTLAATIRKNFQAMGI